MAAGMPFIFLGIIPVKADRPDLYNAYESYKLGMTDRETYLDKENVDVFVAEIVVRAKDRGEIKWKFKDEFREADKGGNCSK